MLILITLNGLVLFKYNTIPFTLQDKKGRWRCDVIMEKEILEYIKYGVWILFGSGMLFEISPIKFNPITSTLNWIGKKLNKDVEEKLSMVDKKVDLVQVDLQNHKVESWRRDILEFADSLMMGKRRTREQFDYVVRLHDSYEKYIEERGIDNGQIDLAYKHISKCYQECRDNNSFYTGK